MDSEYDQIYYDNSSYLNWIIEQITPKNPIASEYAFPYWKGNIPDVNPNLYSSLIVRLDSIPFKYNKLFPLDENRLIDGIDFRKSYEREFEVDLKRPPNECSFLEMMVALSSRLENEITSGAGMSSKIGWWFWYMIESMNLIILSDVLFDQDSESANLYLNEALNIMEDRLYEPDGRGGLFTICRKSGQYDMRRLQIWDQAMVFLDEIYGY